MPLDRLIDLLAEAAVRKLAQEREQKDATPDAMSPSWCQIMKNKWSNLVRHGAFAPVP